MKKERTKNSSATNLKRPNLLIISSLPYRREPSSPLLRFVRDYSVILKKYNIHTTRGTARVIRGTGMYSENEISEHLSSKEGGIAQLAAMVARGDCVAAILLLDPGDPWSDAVENRALKRVCIQRQVRLITTYAAAVRWATYEGTLVISLRMPTTSWRPSNWIEGNKNTTQTGELRHLKISERSIALISHDKKKLEMVQFVNANSHSNLLGKHQRILTTGTTGWLLKFLFGDKSQVKGFRKELRKSGKEGRLSEILEELLKEQRVLAPSKASFDDLLGQVKDRMKVKKNKVFVDKIMPLPSGPDGGDVLIANEVLKNECHTIIFFHDPMTSHPHNDDIRLLERACQLPGHFAECVSDRLSAEKWVEGLRKEMAERNSLRNLAQELRQFANLQDVVIVSIDNDTDSDKLGQALARACGGYLNQRLHRLVQERKEIRIGVAWGWGARQVAEELVKLEKDELLQRPQRFSDAVVWSPLIGITTAEIAEREANMIAQRFCQFYGGRFEGISCAGFAYADAKMPDSVNTLIDKVGCSDIILTSASPWDKNASLYNKTGIDNQYFPSFSKAVGTLSGIFLNERGREVKGKYTIVGLGWEGFHTAAKRGSVILVCGGKKRRTVLLAALRGKLVSVLVTTYKTAKWLLQQDLT